MAMMSRMRPAKRLELIPPPKSWEKLDENGNPEFVRFAGQQRQVYERVKPLKDRSEIRPVRDRDGEFVWHPAPPGAQPKQKFERVELQPEWLNAKGEKWHPGDGERIRNPEAVEEFVLHQGRTTNVDLVFNFREDPKALARKAEEESQKAEEAKLLAWARRKMAEEMAEQSGDTPHFRIVREGRWHYVEDADGVRLNDTGMDKESAEALAKEANAREPAAA